MVQINVNYLLYHLMKIHTQHLAAWFKTDEGVEVYKTIEKKLS